MKECVLHYLIILLIGYTNEKIWPKSYQDEANPAQVRLDESKLLPGQRGRDGGQGRDAQQDGANKGQNA